MEHPGPPGAPVAPSPSPEILIDADLARIAMRCGVIREDKCVVSGFSDHGI
jgi:hypothetical protein